MSRSTRHHPARGASRIARPLAVMLALAVLPGTADAQLGGFIKKKIGERLGRGSSGETSFAALDERALGGNVLEITNARVDLLLRALAAERTALEKANREAEARKRAAEAERPAHEARVREYERRHAEWQRAHDAYTKCRMDVIVSSMASAPRPTPTPAMRRLEERLQRLDDAERERLDARMEELEEQRESARSQGDEATARALRETMVREMVAATGASEADVRDALAAEDEVNAAMDAQVRAKCGAPPQGPGPNPEEPAEWFDTAEPVKRAALEASGLSEEQYAVLRERVAAWLAERSAYGFTPAELEVLAQRADELRPHRAQLVNETDEYPWSEP